MTQRSQENLILQKILQGGNDTVESDSAVDMTLRNQTPQCQNKNFAGLLLKEQSGKKNLMGEQLNIPIMGKKI